ncbi:MAG TPA: DNA-3-methyladenine glycosylase [Thermoplasmata archaeon]|nr:DNA-3-methyladenine glycosylase [Thermoplasmata archaeon]
MRPREAPLATAAAVAERFAEPLPSAFYDRPTVTVARRLLGAWLVVHAPDGVRAARVVETEAYVADDPANHAERGPTERNRSMFGAPGTLYVYRIHQVHCANAVTRRGQAVLLRAAEPLAGLAADLAGPGRLCRGMGIGKVDDGTSLISGRVRLTEGDQWPRRVVRAPRVGVSQAADRPLRFLWDQHPATSAPRPWRRRRLT